ncbi:MAG: efflux RND transporter periplasmic adaptor subunit [Balneolaceae bacterium]|nr:efflux RND transporter periplasmic adaptor subunit [Balneolaceae bacterium]
MAQKKSSTKSLLKILGILLLVVVVLGVIAKTAGWLDRGPAEKTVETDIIERRTITQIVSASGRIQPETEVIIRPDVSGEIIELAVNEGDFVRQGDLLVRIKPDIYQAQIDNLNAALLTQQSRMEQARANMLQAEVEFEKNQQLYDQDLISDLEYRQSLNNYEAQKANFKAAEYQIESARAQLRQAEEELEQTVVRAPQDGTITQLAVEQGERVLGQAQMSGTEMMRVARLEQMEIEVDVNENDIVNVSLADTASLEVDAYPNRSFEGVVTEIANSAEVTGQGSAEQITNYKVKVRITTPHNLEQSTADFVAMNVSENPAEEFTPNFKPGMSATVDIKTNTVYDVISVPIQSVTVRDFASDSTAQSDTTSTGESPPNQLGSREDFRKVVFVNNDGTANRIQVETGISDNAFIQIMSGLEDGQEIVTGSYRVLSRELSDGDKIVVSNNN